MRQLLIGNARPYRAQKRSGGNRAELPDDIPFPAQQAEELLAVDEALNCLACTAHNLGALLRAIRTPKRRVTCAN